MPVMGAYWLWPACMASVTACSSCASQSKSGKPWPRLTAWCCCARADMTVKMVVPTWGSRLGKLGVNMVRSQRNLQAVVVRVALHGAQDEVAAQAVAQGFGKLIDKVAQVGAALEGDTRHALAKQVAQGARNQVAELVFAHGHFRDDAHAQAQAHVGFDDVGVDGFQDDARLQLARAESRIELAAPGERGVVGDEGFDHQGVQPDALFFCQWVVGGDDQHMLPFVAGQGDQVGVVGQGFGGHAFFGNVTAPTEIYTLSLHDALPISMGNSTSTWPRETCVDLFLELIAC